VPISLKSECAFNFFPTFIKPVGDEAEGNTYQATAIPLQGPTQPVTPEPDLDVGTVRSEPYEMPPTERATSEPNEEPGQPPSEVPSADPMVLQPDDTINTRFDLSLLQEEDVSEPHSGLSKDEQKMMLWHLRLSHLPLTRFLSMARLNLLPRRLLNVKKLFCSDCAFGRMIRRPRRTKTQPNAIIKTAERPGECISVDQLDSSVPGFIAQLKGIPTIKRYMAATLFVDNFSGLSYLNLQQNLTSAETIKAKDAFEAYAKTYNVNIQHFHADNGRFADNAFRQSCQERQQTISFCGAKCPLAKWCGRETNPQFAGCCHHVLIVRPTSLA